MTRLSISIISSLILGYFIGQWHGYSSNILQTQDDVERYQEANPTIQQTPSFSTNINNHTLKKETPIKHQKETSISIEHLFIKLLSAHQYDEAINLYRTIQANSDSYGNSLKSPFLAHIETLFTIDFKKNQDHIKTALDYYLAETYDDTDALILLSQFFLLSGDYYEGINTAQLMNSYIYTEGDKKKFSAFYPSIIQTIEKSYLDNSNTEELINLYQHLDNTGLTTNKNLYRLTELLLGNGEKQQALYYADELLNKNKWREKTLALLNQFNAAPENNIATNTDTSNNIALEKDNNQFIINTTFSEFTNVRLLIDTGASITTLSKEFYQSISNQLKKEYKGQTTFNTANGQTTGEIYLVDQFKIGNYTLRDLNIAVIDYPSGERVGGLLGMNVLSQFHFTIDQENNTLTLDPR